MAYYFACTPAVHTRLGFCALAVRTDTLSGTTGAFHFAIFTIRAGNSASLSGGSRIEGGWDWQTFRAKSLPHNLQFFFLPNHPSLLPPLLKTPLLFFPPTFSFRPR